MMKYKVVWNGPGIVQDVETGGWKFAPRRTRESTTCLHSAELYAQCYLNPREGMWVELRDRNTDRLLSVAVPRGNKWYGEEVNV